MIAIYDDYAESNPTMSVTNGAENVIEALAQNGIDLTGKTIIYRGTDGRWDGMEIKDDKFVNFNPIGANGLDGALRKIGVTFDGRGGTILKPEP